MSKACCRCWRLEGEVPFVVLSGLRLCPNCAGAGIGPPCGDFHHTFLGSQCTTCGFVIPHKPISTAIVEVPTPGKVYDYC